MGDLSEEVENYGENMGEHGCDCDKSRLIDTIWKVSWRMRSPIRTST